MRNVAAATFVVLMLAWSDLRADFGSLPLVFEENRGQSDSRVRFLARGAGFQLFLTENEAVYRLRGEVLRMRLAGSSGARHISGVDALPSVSHYLDRTPAITPVPHYARVKLAEVYRGIDVEYYGSGTQLEYDFIVAAGADPRTINVQVDGAQSLAIDRQGQLRIRTAAGDVIWRAPVARQDDTPVEASYVLRGRNRFGFHVSRYDRSRTLVIDPILEYSTVIGGTKLENPRAIAVDGSEEAVIAGESASTDFPTTPGAYKTGGPGIFVAKVNAAGNGLVYATFLGSGTANGVALHGGHAHVTGSASSAFPVTAGAVNNSVTPGGNVFVTRLTADGSGLVYSALLAPGSGSAMAIDSTGAAYVTGNTATDFFPTTPTAFQPTRPTLGDTTYTGDLDAFFIKLDPSGSTLLYSTYLGSTHLDLGNGIAVDTNGHAYVVGSTQGRFAPWNGEPAATLPFPTTTGAYRETFVASANAFVTKFDPSASGAASLLYSTLLGVDNEGSAAEAVAVDSANHAYVTGPGGPGFPLTSGAYGAGSTAGGSFVTKLDTTGSQLVYSAMIAGGGLSRIALDSSNSAFVSGRVASSSAFATVDPLPGGTSGNYFLVKLDASGSSVAYATRLDGWDSTPAVAVDPFGAAYVGGQILPASLNTEAFVARIVTNRRPVARAGSDIQAFVGVTFTLDAGASSDPDGDALTYVWKDASGAVVATTETVALQRPQGIHSFTVTVSDGVYSTSDSVAVTVDVVVTIDLYGFSTGRVTSSDGKVDCPTTCMGRYAEPVQITLTATPSTGAVFAGWGGSGCSGSGPCVLTMNAHHVISAQFDVQQLTLSVTTTGNGKLTSPAGIDCGATCSAVNPYGTIIELTAVPDYGHVLDGWSGACAGTTGAVCTLVLKSDLAAGVTFKENPTVPAGLSIAPSSATIAIRERQPFTAVATFSDGAVRLLSAEHSVEASDADTCAINRNGLVKCWGINFPSPAAVPAFENAVSLSAGTAHVCALLPNGTVNCCSFISGVPTCDQPVPGITNAVAIASSSLGTCALLADGTVSCFAIGVAPAASGITNAVAIGAEGGGPPCAVIADGTIQCVSDSGPQTIDGISNAIAVTVGPEHACALLFDGTVSCWGRNQEGQLGNGTTDMVQVYSPAPVIGVSGVISVVAGDYHNCALLSDRTVQCWGRAYANGSASMSSTAIPVSNLAGAVGVAAGSNHNCATLADGTLECWGWGAPTGALVGISTTATPVPVGMSNVIALQWSSSGPEARMMAGGTAAADIPGQATIAASAGALAATASLTITNTSTGSDVNVPLGNGSSVTFSSVTQGGQTTITSSGTGTPPPAGFQLGDPPVYYDVSTTAVYGAPVTVCINYAGIFFAGEPRLFHDENGAWADVTTSVDTANLVVCGSVSSLSPFALFAPLNRPPVAEAGPDLTGECATAVALDGSGSSDPDGDALTYIWMGSFGTLHGLKPSVMLPLGVTTVTLTVSDGRLTSTDTVQITVRDTTAPAIHAVVASPNVLWPPDRKLVTVTITPEVSDACDVTPRCRIVSVTSNEPITSADWQIAGDLAVRLRAERLGPNDRTYTVTIRCDDASSNSSTRTVEVIVPRDQGRR